MHYVVQGISFGYLYILYANKTEKFVQILRLNATWKCCGL